MLLLLVVRLNPLLDGCFLFFQLAFLRLQLFSESFLLLLHEPASFFSGVCLSQLLGRTPDLNRLRLRFRDVIQLVIDNLLKSLFSGLFLVVGALRLRQ